MVEIYPLLFHLRQCPEVFLHMSKDEPENNPQAYILIKDMYRKVYGHFNVDDSLLPQLHSAWRYQFTDTQLIGFQVACWFLSHSFFSKKPDLLSQINVFLIEDVANLCKLVQPRAWIDDEDRAEEFVRMALRRLSITPLGESAAAAADRLDALDSAKRLEVLRDSSEAYERIQMIRKQMEEEKAREAANGYGRE